MTGVYVQTNEAGTNRVLAFSRAADGTLTQTGDHETGGAGDGVPHLTSQGSVVLSGDGKRLYVTNAASGDVSVFSVGHDGLELIETTSTGAAPKSVAEHDGLVVVLNTGDRSLTLLPSGETVALEATDPAQVGFSPDGGTLLVTDRGTDALYAFPVRDGKLGEPQATPSSGQTPYGFAFTSAGGLVVTEAFGAQKGKAAASSYALREGSVQPVTRSVGNGRSEICWAVVTKDGRYAFTTNFADGAVSRYAIAADGSLELEDAVAATSIEGSTGLRDECLTDDGRFLYAIDADAQRILGWSVGEGGSLTPVGSWTGVPATVAGIAAA
jgi:6-phosphogluconolactonase